MNAFQEWYEKTYKGVFSEDVFSDRDVMAHWAQHLVANTQPRDYLNQQMVNQVIQASALLSPRRRLDS